MLIQKPEERDKYGIFRFPAEWNNQAKHFYNDIKEQFPDLNFNLRPATRGGWKSGYSWSGKYLLKINLGNKTIRKYINGGMENAYLTIFKIMPEVKTYNLWFQTLRIYRNSKLIPKKIAKKHNIWAKSIYGDKWHENIVALNQVRSKMFRYLKNHSKCPYCSHKGMTEDIAGITCQNCNKTFDDLFTYKWV